MQEQVWQYISFIAVRWFLRGVCSYLLFIVLIYLGKASSAWRCMHECMNVFPSADFLFPIKHKSHVLGFEMMVFHQEGHPA